MGRSEDAITEETVSPLPSAPDGFVAPLPHKEGLVVDLRAVDPELTWEASSSGPRPYCFAKRTFDLVVSAVMTIFLSPIFLVLALMVTVSSPGPVFFRQKRVGRYGEPFALFKFRTMADGADESHHRHHCEQLANTNSKLVIDDDPRVTRVGRFLRKWSLDELPNLFNVLKGDMSLVGPRPLVPYELVFHEPDQLRRLEVLPGVTGLAQVNGRLQMTLDERADFDLEYIDHCSFWQDVGVLFRTIPAIMTKRGA